MSEHTTWHVAGSVGTAAGDVITMAYFDLSDAERAALPEGSDGSGIAVTVTTKGGKQVSVGISPLDALLTTDRLTRAAHFALERFEADGRKQAAPITAGPSPYL